MASRLTSRMSKLNPFAKSSKQVDDEDAGEVIDASTVAGGGHAARETDVTQHQLRISSGLRSYLVSKDIISERDAGLDNPDELSEALHDLVNKDHINVPSSITDRSHPLAEYFISSSHNTYLVANQLYGSSSVDAYKTALTTGSRCVEIDAWDNEANKEEPKVTHGYTLVAHIPFRAVCETIRDVVDEEAARSGNQPGYGAAPILLSLENHCGAEGQLRLVDIMQEVWGDRLLSKAIREKGHQEQKETGEHVRLEELGSKIVLIVEYHFPSEPKAEEEEEEDDTDPDEDEEAAKARKAYNEQKKAAPTSTIIPELADLGVYAQSCKPVSPPKQRSTDVQLANYLARQLLVRRRRPDRSTARPPHQHLRIRSAGPHARRDRQDRPSQRRPPDACLSKRHADLIPKPQARRLLGPRRSNLRSELADLRCKHPAKRSPVQRL